MKTKNTVMFNGKEYAKCKFKVGDIVISSVVYGLADLKGKFKGIIVEIAPSGYGYCIDFEDYGMSAWYPDNCLTLLDQTHRV